MPENVEVTGGDAEVAPPGGDAQQQQQQTQAQAPQQTQAQPKNVVVPTAAMKRIKEEEYSRGKQAALEELARSAGYETHADLVAALARTRQQEQQQNQQNQQTQTQTQQQKPPQDEEDPAAALQKDKDARREEGRYQRQIEKLLNERNRYASSASEWRRKADEARAEADAVRAEMHLRTVAAGAGIQDIDYAIVLFSREVEKMTPEEAEQFDEKAYFSGLRQTRPLLFGEAVVPATTGTGTGGAPKPPAPNQVTAANGQNGKVDARKMDNRAYNDLLAKRGIVPGV